MFTTFEVGKTFGEVPLGLLNVVPGNQSYFTIENTYALIDYYEFVTDTYASLHIEHNFNGRFLSRVPLLRKLNLREIVGVKGVWGEISDENLALNASNINSVGLVNYDVAILNFRTYPYILMISSVFSAVINHKESNGVFAKLFLTGNPNSMIYDQYVQIIEDVPITNAFINEIEFKFLTPDGNLYNFNGQDHSFTLEIYEQLDEQKYD